MMSKTLPSSGILSLFLLFKLIVWEPHACIQCIPIISTPAPLFTAPPSLLTSNPLKKYPTVQFVHPCTLGVYTSMANLPGTTLQKKIDSLFPRSH